VVHPGFEPGPQDERHLWAWGDNSYGELGVGDTSSWTMMKQGLAQAKDLVEESAADEPKSQ
jgi:hypothetical protein